MNKVLSAAKMAKKKRDEKIVALYDKWVDDYDGVSNLYFAIAQKMCCSFPTVTRVLKAYGRI